MAKLTSEEKATRAAARKALQAERLEREQRDKALVLDAMRSILSDPTAKPSQRIYAFAVLNYVQYYQLIPYNLPYPDKMDEIDLSRLKEKFADELEAFKAKETGSATNTADT